MITYTHFFLLSSQRCVLLLLQYSRICHDPQGAAEEDDDLR